MAAPPPSPKVPSVSYLASDRHLKSLLRSCKQLSCQMKNSGVHSQNYIGALRAIDSLIRAIGLQQQSASSAAPNQNPHTDAGGGIIAVDLDEAIHGLYTAISYTKNASANGFGALGESLGRDANLWARDPKAWLTQTAMPHGAADVSIAAVVTVALVPFALMALAAGIGEIRESKLHGKALKLELAHSRDFLKTLEEISTSFDANSALLDGPTPTRQFRDTVDTAIKVCTQQLDALTRASQKNQENGQIGACSAMSGGAIAVKATLDLSAKVGYLALAGNAAGTALATSVGAAGAILAPIAAISAVGLGAKMVMKSNEALKNFEPVCKQLKNRLESDSPLLPPDKASAEHDYLKFLPKKLDQRSRFFRSYAEKNKRFLLGSTLYAAGAVASFALTGAALLGAGIVLGPIGMGILVAVGITGGLLMGRYSTQFLFGHGRQHRYENYSIGDDPELDRHFLGTVEAFTDKDAQIRKNAGIGLRAAFYRQAATREGLRQDFLTDAAGDLEKRYHDMRSYSTDSDEVRAKRGGAPSKWAIVCAGTQKKTETIAGYSRAGLDYFSALLHSRSHATAKIAAGAQRQANKPTLSVSSLHNWLEQGQNTPKQILLMHDSLGAQIDYLREKTALRLKMFVLSNNISVKPAPPATDDNPITAAANIAAGVARILEAENHQGTPQINTLLDQLATPLIHDADILGQAENLHAELARYRADPPSIPTAPALSRITSRFLNLQRGQPCDPATEMQDLRQSQAALAHHYMKEAPGRYRNLRGLLVDTELQATRLMQRKDIRAT
jgi:hypothetical protein